MNEETRATRLLWLFTALPLLFFAALWGIGWIPSPWRNLYLLGTIGGLLTTVITITVREHNRRERNEGLVPKQAGFSRRVMLLATKLREHAAEMDGEPLPRGLHGMAKEIRRLAREQDKRDLKSLDVIDDEAPDVQRLGAAARELELYAREVRARGGIFRLGWYELAIGFILFTASFAWGCSLVWRHWDGSTPAFFGGVALIVSSAGLTYALIRSQRDPA